MLVNHTEPGPMFRNVTTSVKRILKAESTSLRRNPYYYQIYYVYLNTLFASVLPLVLLLFFNINTAIELIKMSRLESRSMAAQVSSVNLNRTSGVNYNPRPDEEDGEVNLKVHDEEVRVALTLAAKAHEREHDDSDLDHMHVESGNDHPLLSHQNCSCDASQALPTITLTTTHNLSPSVVENEVIIIGGAIPARLATKISLFLLFLLLLGAVQMFVAIRYFSIPLPFG
jgi:hypothetical protein